MTTSLQNLEAIATDLKARGKQVTVKVLPIRKMRKGEGIGRDQQHGRGSARGNLGGMDNMTGAGLAVGSGFHCRPINSLGGRPVPDLKKTISRAKAVYADDRRQAALDRIQQG